MKWLYINSLFGSKSTAVYIADCYRADHKSRGRLCETRVFETKRGNFGFKVRFPNRNDLDANMSQEDFDIIYDVSKGDSEE